MPSEKGDDRVGEDGNANADAGVRDAAAADDDDDDEAASPSRDGASEKATLRCALGGRETLELLSSGCRSDAATVAVEAMAGEVARHVFEAERNLSTERRRRRRPHFPGRSY